MTKLDQFQEAFVKANIEDYSVILLKAVAGAGKSTTILHRAIKELDKKLVLTSFTNSASKELQNRFDKLVRENNIKVTIAPHISTIHNIAHTILKMTKNYKKFTVITEWQSYVLLRDQLYLIKSYQDLNKTEIGYYVKKVQETYSKLRNNFNLTLSNLKDELPSLIQDSDEFPKQDIIKTILRYQEAKTNMRLLDYDDMQWIAVCSLLANKELFDMARKNYDMFFIDEAQDLSQIQYELVLLLSEGKQLIMVGDSCQSIYGFRDAVPENFSESYLSKYFKNVKTYELRNNYRSTPEIIHTTNMMREVCSDNIKAIPNKPAKGNSVKFTIVKTQTNIMPYLSDKIKELLQEGYNLSDITIIARSNRFLKTVVEPALISGNIPYKIEGGASSKKMLDKPICQFYLSCIQYYLNENNHYALFDILEKVKGIGQSTLENKIKPVVLQGLDTYPKSEIINDIKGSLHENVIFDYTDLLDNINYSLIEEYGLSELKYDTKQRETILQALQSYCLYLSEKGYCTEAIFETIVNDTSIFNQTENKNAITIATVHSQKGLENKVILATGFTTKVAQKTEKEEANILYVQLSRAIEKLIIVVNTHFSDSEGNLKKGHINPYLIQLKEKLERNKR